MHLRDAHMPPAQSIEPRGAAGRPASLRRIILSTALGNGLEIFDFTVYSFFSAYIGSAFFPTHDPLASLLLAVGTFGVGFFARPVGAAVLGSYADRVGRRAAMTLSILLMALGTGVIALCPTYGQIGWAAPLLVVLGRITQGFAAGGEVGAATTYLMESGSERRRGFMVSWQMVSQGIAAIAGALSGFALSRYFDPQSLAAWGWRLPFVFGMLVAPVGFYIRRHLPDTPNAGTHARKRGPIGQLWRDHRGRFLAAVGLTTGQTVTMYVMVLYMPSYLIRVMHLPAATGFAAAVGSSISFTVFALIGGLAADRVASRKTVALVPFILSAMACLPAFWVVTHYAGIEIIVVTAMCVAGLLGFGVVATLVLMMEMFPGAVRATGFSTSYALANTVFGGTAQFIVTALIVKTGVAFSAAWYVLFCDLLALAALLSVREGRATSFAPEAGTSPN